MEPSQISCLKMIGNINQCRQNWMLGQNTEKGERELSISCNGSIKLSPPHYLGPKSLMVSGPPKDGVLWVREYPLFASELLPLNTSLCLINSLLILHSAWCMVVNKLSLNKRSTYIENKMYWSLLLSLWLSLLLLHLLVLSKFNCRKVISTISPMYPLLNII